MPELRRSARVASKPIVDHNEGPVEKKAKTTPKKEVKAPKTEENEGSHEEIEVGDKVPDIELLDENEEPVSLAKAAAATKYLVIFAYPKASTPGCTRQVCGFQTNHKFLKDANATVYGLSADTPSSQKNFITKQHLEYSLLSDPKRELIGILGAKKSPTGIKRSHWIFVDGVLKVKKIQISPEASISGAKEDIEKFIAENEKSEVKEQEPEEEKPKEEPKGEEKPKEQEEPKEDKDTSVEEPKS